MLWLSHKQNQTQINLELRWDLKKEIQRCWVWKITVEAAKPLQLGDAMQEPKERASVDLETHYPDPGPQKWKCLSQMSVGW